MIWATSSS